MSSSKTPEEIGKIKAAYYIALEKLEDNEASQFWDIETARQKLAEAFVLALQEAGAGSINSRKSNRAAFSRALFDCSEDVAAYGNIGGVISMASRIENDAILAAKEAKGYK